MRRMGNSGKLAVISAVVAGALLVLAAVTLEEWVLFMFFSAVVLGYLASLTLVLARRRYLVLALAFIGCTLFIAFGIAFLRMWGLAFTLSENSLGSAVSSKDSDIYFYLSLAAGGASLLVLFAGAVWPGRRTAPSRPAGRKPAPRPARRPAAAPAKRPASAAQRHPSAKVPAAPAKRPTSGAASQRKSPARRR
ncbi:hypothetical protein [Arthrobacter celericrescens]|uniref:hypothetical protein n=1 Tax=Arthrobacter celericrescens TaxID=2320851 RepID=UPI000EA0373D|nr:hypothetical protein [Arthrobacter celericrescens]